MNKLKFTILIFIIVACVGGGCSNYDEINTDPNYPDQVPPEFLATSTLLNATSSSSGKWLFHDSWVMKTSSLTELQEDVMYNRFDRGDFSFYNQLIDMDKMVDLANADLSKSNEEKNSFKALNLFMKGYFYYKATMEMGDVPCSEALKGESEGLNMPKYDNQEEVFAHILEYLDQASQLFGNSKKISGDFIYDGDPEKWQRTTNAFELIVLNSLSNKEKIVNIDIKSKFEEVALRPLIDSEENSFMRTYSEGDADQWYPFYYQKQNYWSYIAISDYLIQMMKKYQDRRIFYYCEPAPNLIDKGETSYDAYVGVDPTAPFGEIQETFSNGEGSPINKKYYLYASGEPIKFISYSETQFVLAEAAARGWITPMSAKKHYELGVKATLNFTYNHTPKEYRHTIEIDDQYLDQYLSGAAAWKEENTLSQKIELIMEQKYIASFVQLPWCSYFDYRRTGYPRIPINPSTNLNEIPTQMPQRWMYPSEEYDYNPNEIDHAIQRQFGGSDNPNDVMWILR